MWTLKNQPLPSGSVLASDGSARSASLTSTISPLTGMYRSAAALTDSTTPATSPFLKLRPTSGRSTKTTSPSASCAWCVMPTVAASWSSMLIHSWSVVYMVVMGVLLGSRTGGEDGGLSRGSSGAARRASALTRIGCALAAHLGVDLVAAAARGWRRGRPSRSAGRRVGAERAAGDVAELVAACASTMVAPSRTGTRSRPTQADALDARRRSASCASMTAAPG